MEISAKHRRVSWEWFQRCNSDCFIVSETHRLPFPGECSVVIQVCDGFLSDLLKTDIESMK